MGTPQPQLAQWLKQVLLTNVASGSHIDVHSVAPYTDTDGEGFRMVLVGTDHDSDYVEMVTIHMVSKANNDVDNG